MKNYEIFLLVMLTIVLTQKSNAQLGGPHFGFTFPLYRVGKYIFKQGDRSDMNSYRLISLISAIAKVFERIVYNQLSSYLSKNNILSKYQSGFRSFFFARSPGGGYCHIWAI